MEPLPRWAAKLGSLTEWIPLTPLGSEPGQLNKMETRDPLGQRVWAAEKNGNPRPILGSETGELNSMETPVLSG